ncbi:class I SAM-dependent methyltransferase [Pseudanabaena biceps]|nr:class I SAM-dependent methyltransferase [Pseudanabaena biceps]
MIDFNILECPVCKKTQHKNLYSLDKGRLIKCQNCHLAFYIPRPTAEELSDFYNQQSYRNDYEQSVMSSHDFTENRYLELKKIIATYQPNLLKQSNKTFLDIGCGLGDLLSLAIADGWQVTGTEISPIATEQSDINIRDRILIGDILSLDFPESSFDLITIYHVIEHLIDPMHTLIKMRKLLKPDGVLFVETPNMGSLGAKIKGKEWSHIIPPEHITYFDLSSLDYAIRHSGFNNCNVFTSSPQVIKSIENWSNPYKSIAEFIYKLMPILGLGATLQSIAIK